MSDPRFLPAGKLPGELLGRLLERHAVRDERVLIGPGTGRDAAAIRFGDNALVVKSDPITFPTDRPARHLVHINANDIACQGATPKWLLVTALLPHGIATVEMATELFADLNRCAAEVGVEIVGGHTEITLGLDRTILIGTMIGEAAIDRLIDPRNAKPGDRLLMTKTAGIEGTVILASEFGPVLRERGIADRTIATAKSMIVEPGISVLTEARALVEEHAVTAMHDPTEGGIGTALRELAIAAETGLVVSRDAIPVAGATRAVTEALGVDPLGMLASGSLLAAVPKERMQSAEDSLARAGVPFAWIGKLTPRQAGMRLRSGATETDLPEFIVDEVARKLAR